MTPHKLVLLMTLALSGCANNEAEKIQNSAQNNQPSNSQYNASLAFQQQFKQNFASQIAGNDMAVAQSKSIAELTSKVSDLENGLKAEQTPLTQSNKTEKYNINFYVQGMMQDLISNLQYVNSTTPVAVVSFVMLDGDYGSTNLLGNQIAESLMHEIHKFGIPVLDYKTTDFIRVTPEGDFAFTRDYEEINPSIPARYIVGGTMVRHLGGYLINARIVGISSKAVVATAQTFIPQEVSDALINEDKMNSADQTTDINDMNNMAESAKMDLIGKDNQDMAKGQVRLVK